MNSVVRSRAHSPEVLRLATQLGAAVRYTFVRRGTPLPSELPVGLTDAFASDATKLAQWAGFVRKSKLDAPSLAEVVDQAAVLAVSALDVARTG